MRHITMAKISDSPPPTPTAPFKQRLTNCVSPGENPHYYRPGGYHPVNLGDMLNNGQYKVIRKLGEGSFSIVWLAHDLMYVNLPRHQVTLATY